MNPPTRYSIILDLDQTLISSEEVKELDKEKDKEKMKKFSVSDMDGYYTVFERPGLQKFLDFLFQNYNVSVWTAASRSYAMHIIQNIILAKKNRHLDWIFFSYHCDISKRLKKGTKDLNLLFDNFKLPGYTKSKTVILDDFIEVYENQPGNCILAEPFEYNDVDSENDDYLNRLILPLQEMVNKKSNHPAKVVNKMLKKNKKSN